MVKKENKSNYKIESVTIQDAQNPRVSNDVTYTLQNHKSNSTIILFEALKKAKTIDEIIKSRSELCEKYPLESLIIEICAAQEICLAKDEPDIKTWNALQNTKLKYLHKSAESEETAKVVFTADEIVKALKSCKNVRE
jgi:hypothetical protein